MNLFNLTEEIKALDSLIEDHCIANDGDVTDVQDLLSAWSQESEAKLDEKLCDCAWLLKEWGARSEARKNAAKTLVEQSRIDEAKAERLKAWMLYCLENAGISKISAGVFQISMAQAGSGSCIIDVPESEIPEQYIKIERKVNLSAIKEAVKNENETALKLAHIESPKTTLRIK